MFYGFTEEAYLKNDCFQDESFSDAIAPLPVNCETEKDDMLLLTMQLSRPNSINLENTQESNTNINNRDTQNSSLQSVGCFCALLTWLFSLARESKGICSNYEKVRSSVSETDMFIPFTVTSMQQTVLQEELIIHVAVSPAYPVVFLKEQFLKQKKKSKSGQGNAKNVFYQVVNKFLNSMKLSDVVDWNCAIVANEIFENHIYSLRLPDCTLSSLLRISGDKRQTLHLFDSLPGFFWHTINQQESNLSSEDFEAYLEHFDCDSHSGYENVLCLVDEEIYAKRHKMYHLLLKITQMQFDICGLRLLNPTIEQLESSVHYHQFKDFSKYAKEKSVHVPVLALALRGHNAFNKWTYTVGHLNPVLARITEPKSLTAIFGSGSNCFIYVPRNHSRQELVKYFGTRMESTQSVNTKENRFYSKYRQSAIGCADGDKVPNSKSNKRSKETDGAAEDVIASPPKMLCAVLQSNILLLISPLVPFHLSGHIISLCQEFGFDFRGLKRSFIDQRCAQVANIPNKYCASFFQNEDPKPATCIRLSAENASSHSWMLINNIFNSLWTHLTSRIEPEFKDRLFHVAKESPAILQVLGGDFESLPNHITTGSLPRSIEEFHSDTYSESFCVVCFVGKSELSSIGFEIGRLSDSVYEKRSAPQYDWQRTTAYSCEQIELVGLKYRSKLTKSQSRELTVFEVGDPNYSPSLEFLSSNPCIALCLRALNVYERIMKLYNIDSKGVAAVLPSKAFKSVTRFMSYDTRETYRLMKLFFDDSELFADNSMRTTTTHRPSELPTRVLKVTRPNSASFSKQSKAGVKDAMINVKTESIYSSILSGVLQLLHFW